MGGKPAQNKKGWKSKQDVKTGTAQGASNRTSKREMHRGEIKTGSAQGGEGQGLTAGWEVVTIVLKSVFSCGRSCKGQLFVLFAPDPLRRSRSIPKSSPRVSPRHPTRSQRHPGSLAMPPACSRSGIRCGWSWATTWSRMSGGWIGRVASAGAAGLGDRKMGRIRLLNRSSSDGSSD